jgi:tRNA 2-thiouridine synthesizing protein A
MFEHPFYWNASMSEFDVEIDSSGLNCPLPVLKARKALSEMNNGQRLHLIATDLGANKDIPAFCKMTGNPLISAEEAEGKLHFIIEKGEANG